VRAARRARVRMGWLAGETVASLSVRLGVPQSTVYAIVRSTPGLVEERARREAQAAADLEAAVLAWSRDHLGEPWLDGAAALGVSGSRMRSLLGPRVRLHPQRRPPAKRFTDEEILRRVREWVAVHGSSGVGYRAAAQQAAGWPSQATVVARFGTWRGALLAAGLPPPSGSGGPPRRWSDDELVELVVRYFAESQRWSSAGLAQWLHVDRGRPSLALVTQRLGSWPALTRLATAAV